jgi:two-component system sensor histidine kinase ArlS
MPVRLRIAMLFTFLVLSILLIVGGVVTYISYRNRLEAVKMRLTGRANNIANFLRQTETFSSQLIQKIDTSTSGSGRDKEVQVYDNNNKKVYAYSDRVTDILVIDTFFLNKARLKKKLYFKRGKKEAIALYDKENELVIVSATFDEQGKRQLSQLEITLWFSLLGAALISFGGGYLFAGRLLRPIKEIASEVNDISAKNLLQRIPTGDAKDEWHYLSSTLNLLLDRLQQTLDMHRRFISNASHELSTPLASITSQIAVLLHRDREAFEYRNVLTGVHQDALHLSKLIQTLLEFSKASGSESGLEIQPVRIDEVLLRLPAELARTNKEYVVLLGFDDLPEDEDRLFVFGSEELLFTAIKNIVVNACKYTTGHRALVRASTKNNEIHVEIIDNGPGMRPEELEQIFQPFYRGGAVGALPGFGLGLPLVKRIINLHKGRIQVESDVKTGTTFLVILPAAFRKQNLSNYRTNRKV